MPRGLEPNESFKYLEITYYKRIFCLSHINTLQLIKLLIKFISQMENFFLFYTYIHPACASSSSADTRPNQPSLAMNYLILFHFLNYSGIRHGIEMCDDDDTGPVGVENPVLRV